MGLLQSLLLAIYIYILYLGCLTPSNSSFLSSLYSRLFLFDLEFVLYLLCIVRLRLHGANKKPFIAQTMDPYEVTLAEFGK